MNRIQQLLLRVFGQNTAPRLTMVPVYDATQVLGAPQRGMRVHRVVLALEPQPAGFIATQEAFFEKDPMGRRQIVVRIARSLEFPEITADNLDLDQEWGR